MTERDIKRLMQCVTCERNPRDCGCDDSDEDENGIDFNDVVKKMIEKLEERKKE